MKDTKADKKQYGQASASLYMPKELRGKIKAIAKKEHRSFNAQAVLFLGVAVLKYDTEAGVTR